MSHRLTHNQINSMTEPSFRLCKVGYILACWKGFSHVQLPTRQTLTSSHHLRNALGSAKYQSEESVLWRCVEDLEMILRARAFPIFCCNLPEFTQVFGGGLWFFWFLKPIDLSMLLWYMHCQRNHKIRYIYVVLITLTHTFMATQQVWVFSTGIACRDIHIHHKY